MKKGFLLIFSLLFLWGRASPADQTATRKYFVRPLINKDYYTVLREAIQSARESIAVSMFMINRESSPSGPVNSILKDLINAKGRGIKVKVILECPEDSSEKLFTMNSEAIEYLRENGVEAYFDTPDRSLHEKYILIDNRVAFIGAHNLSRAALLINNETSIAVLADPPDPGFAKHFSTVKVGAKVQTAEDKRKKASDLLEELLEQSVGK